MPFRSEFMVAALFKEAELTGTAVYAVLGSADVLEDATNLIRIKGRNDGVQVKVISGVSFLDLALAEINFDFTLGLQLVLPLAHLQRGLFTKHLGMIVCQIEAAGGTQDAPRGDLTMQFLLNAYEPDHTVTQIWTDGLPGYTTHSRTIPLKDLVRECGETKFFSSLYVPPVKQRENFSAHS
ncbi:MAG TPA: hypothetical protein VK703_02330 [Candidatus Acidoferrales bacterium]|nr:hypothetical protein [Candidatus Acidoferrales bacterium]